MKKPSILQILISVVLIVIFADTFIKVIINGGAVATQMEKEKYYRELLGNYRTVINTREGMFSISYSFLPGGELEISVVGDEFWDKEVSGLYFAKDYKLEDGFITPCLLAVRRDCKKSKILVMNGKFFSIANYYPWKGQLIEVEKIVFFRQGSRET